MKSLGWVRICNITTIFLLPYWGIFCPCVLKQIETRFCNHGVFQWWFSEIPVRVSRVHCMTSKTWFAKQSLGNHGCLMHTGLSQLKHSHLCAMCWSKFKQFFNFPSAWFSEIVQDWIWAQCFDSRNVLPHRIFVTSKCTFTWFANLSELIRRV